MQRISILPLVLVVCFATAMQAQAQAPKPKPDPEVKKLHADLGHWTYEGEAKPGPLGPAGKFTGEFNGQMILGGFFFQGRWTEKGPTGEERGLELDGYDPVNKNFSSEMYLDDGSRFSGALTVAGNAWTYEGKLVMAGKQYQFKGTFVLAPDLASGTYKTETSLDGKTWTTSGESKWTKVQPAPKK
jgi:hypothetical protein